MSPPVDTAVSLYYFAFTIAGALLASLGAIAAASLLGYSRSLLAAELENEFADEDAKLGKQVHTEIAKHDTEYLAVAFVYTVAGWILGLWALRLAVASEYYVTALVTFGAVMLLVAGSLPVAITKFRAERTLLAVRPAVRLGWFVLRWPLVMPLLGLTRLCLLVLRIRAKAPSDTAEVHKQVMAAVADSTEDTLEGEERAWIGNIVQLKELQVSTIMTQRPDIIAFERETSIGEVIEAALEHGFSRYPVYRERIDDVVGIFYVKDALKLLQEGGSTAGKSVESMMRDTLFVPESMGAAQLLRRFQAGNQHMAIVLDEYGTTAGIVSVEDVLEQIVGEIADEYDEEGQEEGDQGPSVVIEEGRVVEVPARATIADVNGLLGSNLPEDSDWETIAGLVIAHCNRIPRPDENLVIAGIEFVVLAADERRLKRLRLTMLASHPSEVHAVQVQQDAS
ncbi:MAG: hemolysin family protein [bacterium]|nr:hemolysin family protein [bacterium]